jgi:hypothetical protein
MDAIRRQFQYLSSTLGHNTAQRRLPGLPSPAGFAGPTPTDRSTRSEARTEAVAAVHKPRPLIGHPSMIALLIALGAVVGAKFLASTERVQPATPTIMAGPNYKIQPDLTGTTPAGLTSGGKTRAAQDQTGSINIVGSTPVSPAAASTPGVATARLASNSYFPEPKMVKAVTTDARGRIINPAEPIAVRPEALPAVRATAAPVAPKVATATPAAPVTVAKLEKTTVRVDMPPDVDVNVTTAAQSPVAQAPVAAAPVAPATPVVAVAAPPVDNRKPANVAETASFGRSTGVSVQIAAAGTEEEARAVADRFEQRFAYELDGRKLSIIQATPKDKVVYRVRLTEVSRNEADTICGQLRANRIGCFVAKD